MKMDREMKALRQAKLLKKQLDETKVAATSILPDTVSIENGTNGNFSQRHKQFLDKWLEYNNHCNAIHIFVMKPHMYETQLTAASSIEKNCNYGQSGTVMDNDDGVIGAMSRSCGICDNVRGKFDYNCVGGGNNIGHNDGRNIVSSFVRKTDMSDKSKAPILTRKSTDKIKLSGIAKETVIVYVSVALLMVSLMKATVDMTKYLREVSLFFDSDFMT